MNLIFPKKFNWTIKLDHVFILYYQCAHSAKEKKNCFSSVLSLLFSLIGVKQSSDSVFFKQPQSGECL